MVTKNMIRKKWLFLILLFAVIVVGFLCISYVSTRNYPCSLRDLETSREQDGIQRLIHQEKADGEREILFYEGNLSLCENDSCAVIGSRNTSQDSYIICRDMTTILSKRYTIVSGLAKGVDGCAHESALHASTIGVIGCGLDIVYPKQHSHLYKQMKQHHLIVSEYPLGVKPLAHHFPWRNRILAALSAFVVVIEARCKSGTMLTVNEALTLGIPVYCVPQPFLYEQGKGCNLLISQGAEILIDMEDVKCLLHKNF